MSKFHIKTYFHRWDQPCAFIGSEFEKCAEVVNYPKMALQRLYRTFDTCAG